jgi:hypothetical protein
VTWLLAASVLQGKLIHMQLDEIKKFVDRYPFRPFSVRLSNGASYTFRELRDFGGPKDCHVLVYFGEKDWVLIDPDNVVEVIS